MFKALQRLSLQRMSSVAGESHLPSTKFEYLLLPTNLPIPPYYFYSTKINQYLYEYLSLHKIRNIAAFAIRPGVYRRNFFPLDRENLEKERILDHIQLGWAISNGLKGPAELQKPWSSPTITFFMMGSWEVFRRPQFIWYPACSNSIQLDQSVLSILTQGLTTNPTTCICELKLGWRRNGPAPTMAQSFLLSEAESSKLNPWRR